MNDESRLSSDEREAARRIAHKIAEALEEGNPIGTVLGEHERAIIVDALDYVVEDVVEQYRERIDSLRFELNIQERARLDDNQHLLDRITDLEMLLTETTAERDENEMVFQAWRDRAKKTENTLRLIKEHEGRVCELFTECDHVACQSSYRAWSLADEALEEVVHAALVEIPEEDAIADAAIRGVPGEVRQAMSAYLEDDAIPRWWRSSIPAFDGRTPQEIWKQDPDKVRQLIDAYASGSYL